MVKLHVKEIIVKDRIYFKKEDIMSTGVWEGNYSRIDKNKKHYSTLDFDEETQIYSLPSNAWWTLDYEKTNDYRNFPELDYSHEAVGKLYEHQQVAVDEFFNTSSGQIRSGILQAECSWGKTYAGVNLLSRVRTKCLILVHTKMLFRQWEEELRKQIPGVKVGLVGDGTVNIQDITVGLYKTVGNNIEKLKNEFGLVIVDEVHRAPATLFLKTLNCLNAKVKIGMSATPFRKDGRHVILPEFFTTFKVVGEQPDEVDAIYYDIRKTPFKFSIIGDPKRVWTKEMTKLVNNKPYIELIAKTAIADIKLGRCVLIVADRISMLRHLQLLIPNSTLLIGETNDDDRSEILRSAGSKYNCILSTKIFDEGVSCHRLDTLYFVCPFNNPGLLQQRIGRIKREHPDKLFPLVRDFWLQGAIVQNQQNNRITYYQGSGFINVDDRV